MDNCIELRGLTRRYDGFTLGPVDLSLPTGYIMGFIGENGAGKTTTIKAMLGLIRSEGAVRILGAAKEELERDGRLREHIGVVTEEAGLPENLNAAHMGSIMSRIYKTWDAQRFSEYLQRFELPAKKKIKELSRGMKLKLALSVAFSHDSRLLILDEATSGLDPVVRDEILELLQKFIEDGEHSVFISSHVTADLEKICDYVAFIHKGQILYAEQKDSLLERHAMLRCSAEALGAIDPAAVVGCRYGALGAEALVQRALVPQGTALDRATLDDIMLYNIKGEKLR